MSHARPAVSPRATCRNQRTAMLTQNTATAAATSCGAPQSAKNGIDAGHSSSVPPLGPAPMVPRWPEPRMGTRALDRLHLRRALSGPRLLTGVAAAQDTNTLGTVQVAVHLPEEPIQSISIADARDLRDGDCMSPAERSGWRSMPVRGAICKATLQLTARFDSSGWLDTWHAAARDDVARVAGLLPAGISVLIAGSAPRHARPVNARAALLRRDSAASSGSS